MYIYICVYIYIKDLPQPPSMAAAQPSRIVQHLQRFGHAAPDDLPGVVEHTTWHSVFAAAKLGNGWAFHGKSTGESTWQPWKI